MLIKVIKYFIYLLVTGFGIGKSPIMPGTLGSILSIPIWLLIVNLFSNFYRLFLIFLLFLFGCFCCYKFTLKIDKHDHNSIVIDEIFGMFLLLEILKGKSCTYIIIGFLIFRLLDIYKPWPISYIDNKKNTVSIMLDDLLASIIASILVLIICFFNN